MDVSFQALIDRLDQLPAQFDELRGMIRKAVRLADTDPEMALTRVRKVLEYVVHDTHERLVKEPPGTRPLENLLQRLGKDGHLPPHLTPYATFIRELGNVGTHRGEGNYTILDVHVALIQLRAILDWYFEKVRPDAASAAASPDPAPASDEPPRPAGVARLDPSRDRPVRAETVNVFVSYRRDDSLHQAGRLYDRLVARFGSGQVFKDVDSIPLGADFREVLTERVAGCDVLLAVIGDTWLSVAGKRGTRRLDDLGDFVRIEIEAALSRRIPVIPVLVGHSSVPPAEELPEALRALSFRNGLAVRPDPDFHKDVDRLIRGIEDGVAALRACPAPRETSPPGPGAEKTGGPTSSPDLRAGSSTAVKAPGETARPLPERFGRYRIIKRLGQGSMGSVYLAEDTQLNRQVALKAPDVGPQSGPEARTRFLEEARTAASLDHPYLCPVFDVGEIDGRIYLTRAYIEGQSLAEFTRGKQLPPRQAAALLGKLALAMQEAHNKSVIHRRLKPANILIRATGERRDPVIVDFGQLLWENPEVVHFVRRQAAGTLTYMAPEQIRGDGEQVGPACDVYALGVILYELLTGRQPFSGSGLEVAGRILTATPPPPSAHRSDIDPFLDAICLKAMARQVGDRYASMDELAAALRVFLSPPATPAPAGPQPHEPTGSHAGVAPALDRSGEKKETPDPNPPDRGSRGAEPTAADGPPHPPSGQLLPAGERGTAGASADRIGQRAEGARSPSPRHGEVGAEGTRAPALSEAGRKKALPPPVPAPEPAAHPARADERRRPRWPVIVAAVLGFLLLGVIIYVETDKGRIKLVVNDSKAVVKIDGGAIRVEALGEPITLRAGEHTLDVTWGDGEFQTRTFVIRRGDDERLRVEYEPTRKSEATAEVKKPEVAPKPGMERDSTAPPKAAPAVIAKEKQVAPPGHAGSSPPAPAPDLMHPPTTAPGHAGPSVAASEAPAGGKPSGADEENAEKSLQHLQEVVLDTRDDFRAGLNSARDAKKKLAGTKAQVVAARAETLLSKLDRIDLPIDPRTRDRDYLIADFAFLQAPDGRPVLATLRNSSGASTYDCNHFYLDKTAFGLVWRKLKARPVKVLVSNPAGRFFVTSYGDDASNNAYLWRCSKIYETKDGKLLFANQVSEERLLGEVVYPVSSMMAISNDGRWFALAKTVSGAAGTTPRITIQPADVANVPPKGVDFASFDQLWDAWRLQSMSFDPSAKYLIVGFEQRVRLAIFDLGGDSPVLRPTPAVISPIRGWACGPYGSEGKLAMITRSHLFVDSIRMDKPSPPLPSKDRIERDLTCVAFSPGGTIVATGDKDGSVAIRLVGEKGMEQEVLRLAHLGPVLKLAFSADGRYLAALARGKNAKARSQQMGTVRVWVTEGWEPVAAGK